MGTPFPCSVGMWWSPGWEGGSIPKEGFPAPGRGPDPALPREPVLPTCRNPESLELVIGVGSGQTQHF